MSDRGIMPYLGLREEDARRIVQKMLQLVNVRDVLTAECSQAPSHV